MNRFFCPACSNTCHAVNRGYSIRLRIVLICILILCLPLGCSEKTSNRVISAVPVKTGLAMLKDIPLTLFANGTVEAYAVVNVTSRVDGQVMQINIKEGQQVAKGDLLVSIDDRIYQSMLQTAQSNLTRDQIRLEKARKDVARYADLVKKDYVTKNQYEEMLADAQVLEASVQGDQAALENVRLNLSFCRILAPISGRIGSILIDQGNLVKANDSKALMVINQIQPVYIRFSIPEKYFVRIRKQIETNHITITANATDNTVTPISGEVTFIDNIIDPSTGTIDLKATVANTDNTLWPGQFIRVIINLGMLKQVVVVPSQSVQMGQKGNYVFVIDGNMNAELRAISLGPETDHFSVIESGVKPGEIVVTDGQIRLYPGVKVTIQRDAANPDLTTEESPQ